MKKEKKMICRYDTELECIIHDILCAFCSHRQKDVKKFKASKGQSTFDEIP